MTAAEGDSVAVQDTVLGVPVGVVVWDWVRVWALRVRVREAVEEVDWLVEEVTCSVGVGEAEVVGEDVCVALDVGLEDSRLLHVEVQETVAGVQVTDSEADDSVGVRLGDTEAVNEVVSESGTVSESVGDDEGDCEGVRVARALGLPVVLAVDEWPGDALTLSVFVRELAVAVAEDRLWVEVVLTEVLGVWEGVCVGLRLAEADTERLLEAERVRVHTELPLRVVVSVGYMVGPGDTVSLRVCVVLREMVAVVAVGLGLAVGDAESLGLPDAEVEEVAVGRTLGDALRLRDGEAVAVLVPADRVRELEAVERDRVRVALLDGDADGTDGVTVPEGERERLAVGDGVKLRLGRVGVQDADGDGLGDSEWDGDRLSVTHGEALGEAVGVLERLELALGLRLDDAESDCEREREAVAVEQQLQVTVIVGDPAEKLRVDRDGLMEALRVGPEYDGVRDRGLTVPVQLWVPLFGLAETVVTVAEGERDGVRELVGDSVALRVWLRCGVGLCVREGVVLGLGDVVGDAVLWLRDRLRLPLWLILWLPAADAEAEQEQVEGEAVCEAECEVDGVGGVMDHVALRDWEGVAVVLTVTEAGLRVVPVGVVERDGVAERLRERVRVLNVRVVLTLPLPVGLPVLGCETESVREGDRDGEGGVGLREADGAESDRVEAERLQVRVAVSNGVGGDGE